MWNIENNFWNFFNQTSKKVYTTTTTKEVIKNNKKIITTTITTTTIINWKKSISKKTYTKTINLNNTDNTNNTKTINKNTSNIKENKKVIINTKKNINNKSINKIKKTSNITNINKKNSYNRIFINKNWRDVKLISLISEKQIDLSKKTNWEIKIVNYNRNYNLPKIWEIENTYWKYLVEFNWK